MIGWMLRPSIGPLTKNESGIESDLEISKTEIRAVLTIGHASGGPHSRFRTHFLNNFQWQATPRNRGSGLIAG